MTPKIVAGLKEILDEADGDYSAIDGFEEISEENQAKVREAIEQGHISDSDWKGVRGLNSSRLLYLSTDNNITGCGDEPSWKAWLPC